MTENIEDAEYELEPEILESEVQWAIETLANGKAPGHDGISIELVKILKEGALKLLTTLCRQLWKAKQ
ncbi:unnamed protein product [Rotaria sp. Silwood2]|nr:unnamed protein product [Rotaria sp. Silwood2]CAF4157277.1 unnamed protein product [Rotaria sp. Silwood2]